MALLARLLAQRFQPFVTFDGTAYIGLAESMRSGALVESLFPPGYPALIALAMQFLPDRVQAAAAVSMTCGALLPVPVAILARRTVGARYAWLPVLLVALHPVLAHFSALSMSESAFLLALVGALALLAMGLDFRSGLAFGAAFAIRPEALVVAALALLSRVVRARHGRDGMRGVLSLVLGFVLLAAPCWVYFRATLGVWTVTPKVSALRAPTVDWRAAEPRLERGPSSPARERFGLVEQIRHNGVEAARHYPRNLGTVARELNVVWPLPLLALSLWGLLRRRNIECATLPWLAFLPVLGLSFQPRFALAVVPTLAILASVPLAEARSGAARAGFAAVLVVGLGVCYWAYLPEFTSAFDGSMGAAKRAGEWVRGVTSPSEGVMGRKPFVAFYAQRENTILPDEPYETILDLAYRQNVRFLVVEERLVETSRPQLAPIVFDLDFLAREQRLELAYLGGDDPGHGLALFRLVPPGEARSARPPIVDYSWKRAR